MPIPTNRPCVYVSVPDPAIAEPIVSSFVGTVNFCVNPADPFFQPLRGAILVSPDDRPTYKCELGYTKQAGSQSLPFIDLHTTDYESAVGAVQRYTGADIGYYSSDPRFPALRELKIQRLRRAAEAKHQVPHRDPVTVGELKAYDAGGEASPPEGPSLMQMAANLADTAVKFAASGFATVSSEQHAERMAICNTCEFWDAKARAGMGKCLKCGCTGAKQWVAVSVCPVGKWGAVAPVESVDKAG